MTLTGGQPAVETELETAPITSRTGSPPAVAVGVTVPVLGAVVVGMLAASVYRQGAFYPVDAFGMAVASVLLVVWALRLRHDLVAVVVTASLGGLAIWWDVRARMEGTPAAVLPIGASLVGFLAAYLVVRNLDHRDRSRVAAVVVAIGTATASVGVAGTLVHWHPVAQIADGSWRLSSTLTSSSASAVLFAVSILLALSFDLRTPLPRLAVCCCLAGMIVARSPWELLALGVGAFAVPIRQWTDALWPLVMGAVAGLVIVDASTGTRPSWLSVLAVVVATAGSVVTWPWSRPEGRQVAGVAALVVVAAGVVLLEIHPPNGREIRAPADQNQRLAWSAASDAWKTSLLTGVGPARPSPVRVAVDAYPGLAPDGYLTVLADAGIVGGVLLLAAGAAIASDLQRRERLATAAVGATVAFAVAGVVDTGWHLPALALVGGCAAGLGSSVAATGRPVDRQRARRLPSPVGPAGVWVAAVMALVTAQLVVGAAGEATGVPTAHGAPPRRRRRPTRQPG